MAQNRPGFSKFRSRWWALVEIERQIRCGRACTCRSLAQDLEVDPRTVRRYITFMRDELGAPIEYDPIEQTYAFTHSTWTMPNVHLSEAELVALAVGARSLQAVMPPPFIKSLEMLLTKLLDALPPAGREELRLMQERIDFVSSAVSSKGQEWVEMLMQAMRDQCTIEMKYFALSKGEQRTRRVDPYHLRFFAGAWYLVGYDHQTKHFPVFNIARVKGLKTTEDRFRRRDFSAAAYFQHSVGVTLGGPARKVRLLLKGRAAQTAQERVWPAGFTYTPKSDASGLLVGRLGKLDDLLSWLAAIGGEVVILPEDRGSRSAD